MTPNERHDPLQEADAQRKFASAKVSDLCRYFGLGFLALSYSIVMSDSEVPKQIVSEHGVLVFLLGVSGALTVAVDFVQYFAAYMQAKFAMQNPDGDYLPEKKWWSTKLRFAAYSIKQYVCLFGVVILIIFSFVAFQVSYQIN